MSREAPGPILHMSISMLIGHLRENALSIDCINILSGVSVSNEGLWKTFPESRVNGKIRALLWKK